MDDAGLKAEKRLKKEKIRDVALWTLPDAASTTRSRSSYAYVAVDVCSAHDDMMLNSLQRQRIWSDKNAGPAV
jgi:hypothetical protein